MRISPPIMREKFQREQSVDHFKMSVISKATKLYHNNGTFVSPIYTFPWRET